MGKVMGGRPANRHEGEDGVLERDYSAGGNQEAAGKRLGQGVQRDLGRTKLREQMERQAHRVTGYEVGMRTGEAKLRG